MYGTFVWTRGALNGRKRRFPARAEIGFLYLYTLKYSMYAALATGLRLTPLNRDRTHVAQFLVRSALELGYITEPLHGVDPMKEPVAQNQCLLTIMVVLYKAKIALTGFRPGPRGAFRRP